jgi:RNA polymerase I-specific transcription-initiation factor
MTAFDPEELTSTTEQIGHQLEEKGFQVRSLYIGLSNEELDPEEDPGSIASIYRTLTARLPSRDLGSAEIKSKILAAREVAVDVGCASIGVLKPNSSSDTTPLNTLRKFIDIDASIELSEAANFVLAKWGEVPQAIQPLQAVSRKRRREKPNQSENIMINKAMSQLNMEERRTRLRSSQNIDENAPITMSQPERGKHGMRTLRKKVRRSGF